MPGNDVGNGPAAMDVDMPPVHVRDVNLQVDLATGGEPSSSGTDSDASESSNPGSGSDLSDQPDADKGQYDVDAVTSSGGEEEGSAADDDADGVPSDVSGDGSQADNEEERADSDVGVQAAQPVGFPPQPVGVPLPGQPAAPPPAAAAATGPAPAGPAGAFGGFQAPPVGAPRPVRRRVRGIRAKNNACKRLFLDSLVTIIEVVYALVKHKVDTNMTTEAFEGMLKMFSVWLPQKNNLPTSYFVCKSILGVQNLDEFWRDSCPCDEHSWDPADNPTPLNPDDKCPRCSHARYKPDDGSGNLFVPYQVGHLHVLLKCGFLIDPTTFLMGRIFDDLGCGEETSIWQVLA